MQRVVIYIHNATQKNYVIYKVKGDTLVVMVVKLNFV